MTEIKNNIEQLYKMLEQYPDTPDMAHEFVKFLRAFLRIKSNHTLPTIEIMTLIKHHKPIIFRQLKRFSRNNMMLQILTDLSMDIETARKNIEDIMK